MNKFSSTYAGFTWSSQISKALCEVRHLLLQSFMWQDLTSEEVGRLLHIDTFNVTFWPFAVSFWQASFLLWIPTPQLREHCKRKDVVRVNFVPCLIQATFKVHFFKGCCFIWIPMLSKALSMLSVNTNTQWLTLSSKQLRNNYRTMTVFLTVPPWCDTEWD